MGGKAGDKMAFPGEIQRLSPCSNKKVNAPHREK
jgi:hypothetical protein